MWLSWLVTAAEAGCGAWAAPPGTPVLTSSAQVIVALNADRRVVTIAVDALLAPSEFALIVPVPAGVTAQDVSVVSNDLFARFDAYTAPRIGSLSCESFGGDTGTDTGGTDAADASEQVTIVSTFVLGAYEFFVLDATDAGGLVAWLDSEGFVIPESSEPIVQEYLDGGQHLLAARVRLDLSPDTEPIWLEPIQLRYAATGDSFILPIRLGATVSSGEQDLVVYVLSDLADSRVAISNMVETTVEVGCMVRDESFAAFYEEQLVEAFESGTWLTEYAGGTTGDADVFASAPPLTEEEVIAAGSNVASPFLTRLHLRYTPEEATQDLVIYPSGLYEPQSTWFMAYTEELDGLYPVCGEGVVGEHDCSEPDADTAGSEVWGQPPAPVGDDPAAATTGCAGAPALLVLTTAGRWRRRLRR
ncbi:MAG: DUF2330 domain-containing protein [Myxococcales bacterium]|nr:DUF2330 domain-containing protein [Myxococcales bacterium]